MSALRLLILGTRGIPAAHGGFETFAERLACHLVARGWSVTVYCQREVDTVAQRFSVDTWNGVERVTVEVATKGPKATLEFDWHCVRHAARQNGVCLVLGYNGAVFLPYLRAAGRPIITNMDGIEWRRPKWNRAVRSWFWINEWIAAWTSQRLIADHPRIADHLATRRPAKNIVTIPYGGDPVVAASPDPVRAMGLEPDRYLVAIARVEPDNSTALLVEAFSRRTRGFKLVVLGTLDPRDEYHRAVRCAASAEVIFPGAIYDPAIVRSLRFHARAYLHGHTVGGTNPSLVEALWAGNAVIAHDNPYNRWTAGAAGLFFNNADECAERMTTVLSDELRVARCRREARLWAESQFRWSAVLEAYETEILALSDLPSTAPAFEPAEDCALPLSGTR